MIKIKEAFRNKKAFIAYLMAGDPDLETSAKYILTAQEAGADLIEIGIPFSDPIAEGEVIQAAGIRALNAGTSLAGVFGMAASIKDKMRVPAVFMTYANPVFAYGYSRFFARCAEVGVGGIIIPDMPFEEQREVKAPAREHGVEVVTLAAPTSEKRAAKIARGAEGFIYLVSSMGVTGVRSEITTDLSGLVNEIRAQSEIPVAVGFGIASPEQARRFSAVADGVIVGSAIVRIIERHGAGAGHALFEYIKGMKGAMTAHPDL